mgnify:FL=1
MTRKIEVQRPYRHFKGKLYYVHNIVTHTETEEVLVSYQALYPPYGMFVRPLDMFMEEVEDGREDNIDNNDYGDYARRACHRKFSVGADGLLVVKNSDIADIEMVYYNSCLLYTSPSPRD